MATETQSEAIKQYKALMLEINAPAECQSWTDEQIADFATDFILESWKTKQG